MLARTVWLFEKIVMFNVLALIAAIMLPAQAGTTAPGFVKINSIDGLFTASSSKIARIKDEVNFISDYSFNYDMRLNQHLSGDRIILITSPGGDSDAGNDMIDAIEKEKSTGVRIVCVVKNFAHSMAFNILTHCDVRTATPKAEMLVHKLAWSFLGSIRLTANNLRKKAAVLDKFDEPYREANAKAMHLTLKEYDFYADKETQWTAEDLLSMGYLNYIVIIEK